MDDQAAAEDAPPRRAEAALRFLAEASKRLAASLDYYATLQSIAGLAVPSLADWCTVNILGDDGSIRRVAAAHADPAKQPLVEELQRRYPFHPGLPASLTRVLTTGQPRLVPEITAARLAAIARDPEHLRLLQTLGFGSLIVVPLVARGRTLGAISVVAADAHRYGDGDLPIIQDLADRAALAVDNARLYAQAQAEIAERERVESELRQARDQLDAILHGIADGITVQDPIGRLVYANDAAARAMALPSAQALLDMPLADLLRRYEITDEAGRPLLPAQFPGRRALQGEAGPEMAMRFRVLDTGEERWSLVKATPIRDAQGQVQFAVNIFRDTTDHRRAEETQRLLAAATQAFAETSLDLTTLLETIAGWVGDLMGDTCSVVLRADDGEHLQLAAVYNRDPEVVALVRELDAAAPQRVDEGLSAQVLETGQPRLLPVVSPEALRAALKPEYRRSLDRFAIHSILIVPLRVAGLVIGVLSLSRGTPGRPYTLEDQAFLMDLAGRAAQALENARLYREAEVALQARDEFLAVAAHELKTPLTSVRGVAQLARRHLDRTGGLDPSRLRRALTLIDQQAVRLDRLVTNLLNISRLEGGTLILERALTGVTSLVESTAAAAQARTDRHEIIVRARPHTRAVVDALRIEQVLTNLLDNAIKYSPDGGRIEVDLDLRVADGEAAEVVVLSVRDHGLGVPSGAQERIFDRFYQAHAAERASGLGVGLYVSRQIVELHGGHIHAEQPADGGARFMLSLPTGLPPQAHAVQPAGSSAAPADGEPAT
ncbi:MAG: GAF domain-containing protein [Chloroflexota bacterium]